MDKKPLGLYIHWPFCISKCPYCDFNSHVQASVDHAAWKDALLAELREAHGRTPHHQLRTIFFGGGTPSLMPAELVQSLIDEATRLWNSSTDLEITLEANPGTVDLIKFQDFRQAGVNRLSMGVQSLDDQALTFLGRKHGVTEALKAIDMARSLYPRYSFDLIYARPEQTLDSWKAELTQAMDLAGGHLSLYQLTIEKGTAFYTQHQRGDFRIPVDEDAARFYDLTNALMAEHGYEDYEVSNYAQSGHACQHNLIYWRYEDYVGIGPGAHGRYSADGQKWATKRIKAPALWLEAVQHHGHGMDFHEPLSPQEQSEEALLMGLRLNEGVDLAHPLLTPFNQPSKIEPLVRENLVTLEGSILQATPRGRLVLNQVTAFLSS